MFTTVNTRRIVAEAVARRLITSRGGLLDDPNYGFDITGFINDDMSQLDIANLKGSIKSECEKDERVNRADVTMVVPPNGTGAYLITIFLETNDGPFSLVLSVSSVTIDILKVT
jgi:hypothetical protein